jgi:hypothetical protein
MSPDEDLDAIGNTSSDDESDASEREMVDYTIVHAVPGHEKRLSERPRSNETLFVGDELPSALDAHDLEDGEEDEQKGGAVYVFVSF